MDTYSLHISVKKLETLPRMAIVMNVNIRTSEGRHIPRTIIINSMELEENVLVRPLLEEYPLTSRLMQPDPRNSVLYAVYLSEAGRKKIAQGDSLSADLSEKMKFEIQLKR